jgi:hypothetical protein
VPEVNKLSFNARTSVFHACAYNVQHSNEVLDGVCLDAEHKVNQGVLSFQNAIRVSVTWLITLRGGGQKWTMGIRKFNLGVNLGTGGNWFGLYF